MKNQALFSLKDKSKKLKCHLLQSLFGALMVNIKLSAMHVSGIIFHVLLSNYAESKMRHK